MSEDKRDPWWPLTFQKDDSSLMFPVADITLPDGRMIRVVNGGDAYEYRFSIAYKVKDRTYGNGYRFDPIGMCKTLLEVRMYLLDIAYPTTE